MLQNEDGDSGWEREKAKGACAGSKVMSIECISNEFRMNFDVMSGKIVGYVRACVSTCISICNLQVMQKAKES